jgi:hypothetical protein
MDRTVKIKIIKRTPYRKGHQREILPGEVHEVICYEVHPIFKDITRYFFKVDGENRMVLHNECVVIEE